MDRKRAARKAALTREINAASDALRTLQQYRRDEIFDDYLAEIERHIAELRAARADLDSPDLLPVDFLR
jgi:hypothetical protein